MSNTDREILKAMRSFLDEDRKFVVTEVGREMTYGPLYSRIKKRQTLREIIKESHDRHKDD